MYLGCSLKPAIDVGQSNARLAERRNNYASYLTRRDVFLQAYSRRVFQQGATKKRLKVLSGPGTYKIPSVNDIPLNFKVSLLKDVPNPKAIHSSKAVGEPPFFLASAVLFAIKDAIIAARSEEGHNDWFPLDNPATPERIRIACIDDFTRHFASPDYQPKLSI